MEQGRISAEVPVYPDVERREAIVIRRQLEKTVLDKGLIKPIQRIISGEHTYDHKKRIREGFIVPEEVKKTLKEDRVYQERYGVSLIQTGTDNSGQPVVEIRFLDGYAKEGANKPTRDIHFSIGKGSVQNRDHFIEFFPADGTESTRYSFREKEPDNLGLNLAPKFTKMKPGIKRALDTLKRFPDKFKPSIREKVTSIVSSLKPK